MVPPRRRDIGMVFQSYAVWPHMSVRQNVLYPLRYRPGSRADADRRVAETLELVGLSEYRDRPVVALSGGEMQRVALARSLVYRPQLLLLDEPLSNLDAKLRLRLRDELRRILKQAGITALYVTHDQTEAVVLGDQVGVMREGRLLQMAPPNEIYNRPATLFIANFTGASNELRGRAIDPGVVEVDGQSLQVSPMQALRSGDAVRVAFRPESVTLGRRETVNAYRTRVCDCRYLGTQTVYGIELFGRRLEALELGTAARYEIGSEIDVSLAPQACWAYPDKGPAEPAQ